MGPNLPLNASRSLANGSETWTLSWNNYIENSKLCFRDIKNYVAKQMVVILVNNESGGQVFLPKSPPFPRDIIFISGKHSLLFCI